MKDNQRIIKFRAWHNELKIMLYPPNKWDSMLLCRDSKGNHVKIGEETCGNTKLNDILMPATMVWDGRCYVKGYYQDLVFQQFTGLLDKDGKEIYEGDILKIGDHIVKIVFFQGAFQVEEVPDDNGGWIRENVSVWNSQMEITGNIFENPELLKNP